MKGCKRTRGLFIEALYGKLDPEENLFFERHLTSCPACAAEFKALEETGRAMNRRIRREPSREFWDGYWDRLSRRLEMEKETGVEKELRSWGKWPHRIVDWAPRWTFQAAAALALTIAGILIGRTVFFPHRLPVEAAHPAAEALPVLPATDEAIIRARSYVDRSKLVLLALVNYDPSSETPYALDLPFQKQVSRQLVKQAGGLKSDLKEPGRRRLRDLITDLETILIQISNLESRNDLEAFAFVRQGIESRSVFLKINLSEMDGDLCRTGRNPVAEEPPSQKIKT
jgi:Putative zinc-finger